MPSGNQMFSIQQMEERQHRSKIDSKLAKGERLDASDRSFLVEQAYASLNSHMGESKAWRHKASGDLYVLNKDTPVALREADCAPLVLYHLTSDFGSRACWSRPLDEFLEKFERVRKAEHWETVGS